MPPVLSSWAAVFAAQELMYRCEQHLSGSGFSFLIFVRWCPNTFRLHYRDELKIAEARLADNNNGEENNNGRGKIFFWKR